MKELPKFENPNILQVETDIQLTARESSKTISLRCPHCRNVGSFQSACQGLQFLKRSIEKSNFHLQTFIRMCPNPKCRGLVYTVSIGETVVSVLPQELIEFDPSNLPSALLDTLKEAIACHSVGSYRAAAMMVRRLLEELCEDCGAIGSNLHQRLQALRSHITLPQELFEAMDELKALGNDAAHIEGKAYLTIDKEEAKLSIELAQEILKARYQHQSLVDRLRARRKPAQQQP